MYPKKLNTIFSWPEPTTIKQLQSFHGFTNFYCCFINVYSCLTLPFTELTKKSSTFDFSDAAQNVFHALKAKFMTYPVLHHFNPCRPCILYADASNFSLSGILCQPDENNDLHPIAYYS